MSQLFELTIKNKLAVSHTSTTNLKNLSLTFLSEIYGGKEEKNKPITQL